MKKLKNPKKPLSSSSQLLFLHQILLAKLNKKLIESADIEDDNIIVPQTKYLVFEKRFSKLIKSFLISFLSKASSAKMYLSLYQNQKNIDLQNYLYLP